MRLAPPLTHNCPELAFFSTIAADVTVSEQAVEAFFPADPELAQVLRAGEL